MRPISRFALHAASAATMAAIAATGAAAVAKEPMYYTIKLTNAAVAGTGGAAGKGEQIEIHSFHWGSVNSAAGGAVKPTFVTYFDKSDPDASSSGAHRGRGIDIASIDGETVSPAGASRRKAFGGNRAEGASLPPELPVMAGIVEKGASRRGAEGAAVGREKLQPGGGQAQGDRSDGFGPLDVLITVPDSKAAAAGGGAQGAIGQAIGSVAAEGNEPRAQATGKRQHRPLVMRGYYDISTPPPRGTLTVLASGGTCRVGARYPALELNGGGKSYRLRGVTVAG